MKFQEMSRRIKRGSKRETIRERVYINQKRATVNHTDWLLAFLYNRPNTTTPLLLHPSNSPASRYEIMQEKSTTFSMILHARTQIEICVCPGLSTCLTQNKENE